MSESQHDPAAGWAEYEAAIAPPPDAAARIRARVDRVVARRDRVVAAPSESATESPVEAPRAAAAIFFMKSSALSLGIALAGLGTLHLSARAIAPVPAELPAVVAVDTPRSPTIPEPPATSATVLPAHEPAPPVTPPTTAPLDPSALDRPGVGVPARARAAAPEKTPLADTLAEETALIERARQAMDRGAHRDAIALLADHATRFPGGMLARDREALDAISRCRSGSPSNIAASFAAKHPGSEYLTRVREACGDSSTDSRTPSE